MLVKVKPEKSDAVIWLQGDRYDRGKKVLEMYKTGFAKKIIISGNDILIGPKKRPGENNISLDSMEKYLIRNGISKKDIIIDSKSLNTKEQAIHIIKLAKRNGWNKIILVSSTYHQPRVLLSFIAASKLVGYKIKVINQSILIGKNKIASGRVLTNNELMKEELLKIEEYQASGDIASYKNGFGYLEAVKAPKLKFRPATITDTDILLKWRNDPETRKRSHNSRKISKNEHNKWFAASLENSNRKIFIVEYNENPVGVIRTDNEGGVVELSWTVAPEVRGQGIGKEMVSLFVKKINEPIRAEVKVGNEASRRIAEGVGMRLDYKKDGNFYFSKNIKRKK